MAYTNPYKIANGLTLDFMVDNADDVLDNFLGYNSVGQVTSFASIPASRIGSGGDLTEDTSAIFNITGGSGSVLSNISIEVLQASGGQDGYLSSTDWNTFNNKLTTILTSAQIIVGNGFNVATAVSMSGDITITNAGVTAIGANKIVNNQINSTAAISQSKMAALSASLIMATNGSGFATTVAGFTTTIASFLTSLTSDVQAQLNGNIVGLSAAGISTGAATNGYAITWDNGSAYWTLSPIGAGGSVTGPGASTNTAIVRWNGIGGTSLLNSSSTIDGSGNMVTATISVNNSGIIFKDSGGSFHTILSSGSVYTADRTLTLTMGDASRTVTLSGNPTLSDWFDQSVKTSGTPTFTSVTASNAGGLRVTDASASFYMLITTSSVYTAARTLTLVTGDAARTLTINGSGTLYMTGGTDVALADGGTGSSLVDPAANKIMGWDDTDNTVGFWTVGSGLTYTHATHTLSAASGTFWSLATGGTFTGNNSIDGGGFSFDMSNVNGYTFTSTDDIQFQPTTNISCAVPGSYQIILNSISSGIGLDISSTSTAAASNTQTLLKSKLSGANATGSQSTYAGWFENIHTGSGTNVAAYITASGGTTNYSIYLAAGHVGVSDGINFLIANGTGTKFGTGTGEKMGWYNATPIVQITTAVAGATFVANAGTAVNDASTFDGYTMKQVVKALRNYGFLA